MDKIVATAEGAGVGDGPLAETPLLERLGFRRFDWPNVRFGTAFTHM